MSNDRRKNVFEFLNRYSVDEIEADLKDGGFRILGSREPEFLNFVREWIKEKRSPGFVEAISAKPGIFGFNVDLKLIAKKFLSK